MWFSLYLSVILLRSVSCVFTIKIGLDWIISITVSEILIHKAKMACFPQLPLFDVSAQGEPVRISR